MGNWGNIRKEAKQYTESIPCVLFSDLNDGAYFIVPSFGRLVEAPSIFKKINGNSKVLNQIGEFLDRPLPPDTLVFPVGLPDQVVIRLTP